MRDASGEVRAALVGVGPGKGLCHGRLSITAPTRSLNAPDVTASASPPTMTTATIARSIWRMRRRDS